MVFIYDLCVCSYMRLKFVNEIKATLREDDSVRVHERVSVKRRSVDGSGWSHTSDGPKYWMGPGYM